MDDSIANHVITYFNKDGVLGEIRYDELHIEMGEGRLVPLSVCLLEEQEKVSEFKSNADELSKLIRTLNPFYDEIEANPTAYHARKNERALELKNKLPFEKRVHLLNTYYTINSTHARVLRELTTYMLAGSEGDHSAHSISLFRYALNFTCQMMRRVRRKSKRAAAMHSIEAARGAAKNGLSDETIIGTLLHDVIEEKHDTWTEELINRELQDPAYGEICGKRMKDVPVALRHQIIHKYLDAYNDRASGIFFNTALTLYDHIRHFPIPSRYYEALYSIMEIVAKLSRTRDTSYYSYLQNLLYPKPDDELDTISRYRLQEEIEADFPNASTLLDSYLCNVHNFYQSSLGELSDKEEARRNSFREILAKILDRMNNTRDAEREKGFSVPKRLYGTGFKNIYMLQALEDKFRRPSFNTEERRLIEVKFINKPKVAALYQILEDIEFLGHEFLGNELIKFLDQELDRYKATRAFRRLTPPGAGGYFDGLIHIFNEVTLGRKTNLDILEQHRDKQAEVLVAFKAILESFLVYPALIREETLKRGIRNPADSSFRPYRIEGMGPGLEYRSNIRKENGVDLLNIKTIRRRVI
jgi:hypothetical protein